MLTSTEIVEKLKKYYKNYYKNYYKKCSPLLIPYLITDKGSEGIEVNSEDATRFLKFRFVQQIKTIFIDGFHRKNPNSGTKNYRFDSLNAMRVFEEVFEIAYLLGAKKIHFTKESGFYSKVGRWTIEEFCFGFQIDSEAQEVVLELDDKKTTFLLKHFKLLSSIQKLRKKCPSFYGSWDFIQSDFDFGNNFWRWEHIKEKKHHFDFLNLRYFYYFQGLLGSFSLSYDEEGLFLVENLTGFSERITEDFNQKMVNNELFNFMEKNYKMNKIKVILSPSPFLFETKLSKKFPNLDFECVDQAFNYFLRKFGDVKKLDEKINNLTITRLNKISAEFYDYQLHDFLKQKIGPGFYNYEIYYFLDTYAILIEYLDYNKKFLFFDTKEELLEYLIHSA